MNHRQVCLPLFIAVFLSLAHAQELKVQPLQPGNVLRFEVTFSGPDADKIKRMSLVVGLKGSAPPNQAGFNEGFGAQGQLVSTHTFHVDIKIPDNAATGDYIVRRVDANSDLGSAAYTSGFSTTTYHIENPQTFTPPTVSVKPLP
jgi:hypothetical protein